MIFKSVLTQLFRIIFSLLFLFGFAFNGLTEAQTINESDNETATIKLHFVDHADNTLENVECYVYFSQWGEHLIDKQIVTNDGTAQFHCPQSFFDGSTVSTIHIYAISGDLKLMAFEESPSKMWASFRKGKNVYERPCPISTPSKMRIITGTVKDHQGKPVGDAYVGGGEQCLQLPFVKSKADGSFRLPYFSSHFKLSLVQIYAIKPGAGFAYQVTDELYKWAGETPPDKISKSPFHLVLNKPQTVQVRITDENEIPIPNVIVTPHFLVSTKSKGLKQQDYFNPVYDATPAVFLPKTDQTGTATFDWIPTDHLKSLSFTAIEPKGLVKLPDGTSKYFDGSQSVKWNKKDNIVAITLPEQAERGKVKIKLVNTDGLPVKYSGVFISNNSITKKYSNELIDSGIFIDWTPKTGFRSSGVVVIPNREGEVTITANIGDVADLRSVGFDKDHLVFPTIRNIKIENDPKEMTIEVKKGTRVFGTIFDVNDKAINWRDRYNISGWEDYNQDNQDDAAPSFSKGKFDVHYLHDDPTGYEIYLPPGTFKFKIALRNKQNAKPDEQLFDEKTITISNKPIQLDLKLHQ